MNVEPPKVTITEHALAAIRDAAIEAEANDALRLKIDARFHNDLFFGPVEPNDVVIDVGGLRLAMDPGTAKRANGLKIELVDGPNGGFKLDNPNESSPIRGVRPADVRLMLKKRERLELVDVRDESERALARIDAARRLDEAYEAELLARPKDTKLVFLSHHSGRSRATAQRFYDRGFTNVWFVFGGVDAWSTMDPSVPRYP